MRIRVLHSPPFKNSTRYEDASRRRNIEAEAQRNQSRIIGTRRRTESSIPVEGTTMDAQHLCHNVGKSIEDLPVREGAVRCPACGQTVANDHGRYDEHYDNFYLA